MSVNPQRENGYTGIANEILDAISFSKFNGTQFRLLTVIWRYTYGFQRKSHPFSQSFLHERTGLSKDSVKRGIKGLIDKNVLIVVKEATFSNPRELMFNKYYDEWLIEKDEPKTEDSTQSAENSAGCNSSPSPGGKSAPSTGGEIAPSRGGNLSPHIKKELKENIKEKEDEEETRVHVGHVFQFYENNFGGTMTDFHRDFLGSWSDDLSPEIVIEALKLTLLNNASSLKYTSRILNEWLNNNLKRLPDVQRYEKEKFEIKGGPTNGKNGSSRNHGQASSQSRGSEKRSITGGKVGWIKPKRA